MRFVNVHSLSESEEERCSVLVIKEDEDVTNARLEIRTESRSNEDSCSSMKVLLN